MSNNFYIIPCKKNGVAYIKMDKSSFKTEVIYMSEDTSGENLYETMKLEDKTGTIIFKQPRLGIVGICKTGAEDTIPVIFVVNYNSIIEKQDKFIINGNDIIELTETKLEDIENSIISLTGINKILYAVTSRLFPKVRRDKFNDFLNENKQSTDTTIFDAKEVAKVEEVKQIENKEIAKIEDKEENSKIDGTKELSDKSAEDLTELFKKFVEIYEEEKTSSFKRLKTVMEKEVLLKRREDSIIDKEKEVERKLREAKEFSKSVEVIASTTDSVKKELDNTDISHSRIMYESVLKLLNIEDSISIPVEIYKNFKVLIRKHFTMNKEYTEFKAMAEIRFEQGTKEFMLAVIDYSEETGFARISVMKPYNDTQISSDKMIQYELKYNEFRKRNSFINT